MPQIAKQLCQAHYRQYKAGKELKPLRRFTLPTKCKFVGCERHSYVNGFCSPHNMQTWRGGVPSDLLNRKRPIGFNRVNKNGYVEVKDPSHPNANARGWVLEHRKVLADSLGRAILPHENVHHINGDRTDNRIENLELWTVMQPSGQRVEDKVQWAVEFLESYGYSVIRPKEDV